MPVSAPRLADIAPFHVMELLGRARELEAQGRDIIHMEVGEPDFPTPEPIVVAAREFLQDGRVFYTPALGLPELREAISGFYRQRYGIAVPASRIAITAGASGALTLALACLAAPGSEWLLTDPGYPCNRHFVRAFEGVPVSIPVGASSNFQPTRQDLEQHWNERTAGALFASPANPTGTMLGAAELTDIADFVRQRQGQLIIDEIYHGLTYNGDAPTALAAGDDIFVVQSFSKYFQMTGWRLGWMVVPDAMVPVVERLAQNLFICASTVSQQAALACFEAESITEYERRRAEFKARRDYFIPALQSLGLSVPVMPDGAFYAWADCTDAAQRLGVQGSWDFALEVMRRAHVAITPGRDFGSFEPERFVRFSTANSMEQLQESVARLRKLLA